MSSHSSRGIFPKKYDFFYLPYNESKLGILGWNQSYHGIRGLFIGYILSEKIACKSCHCVLVCSSEIVLGQVQVMSKSAL